MRDSCYKCQAFGAEHHDHLGVDYEFYVQAYLCDGCLLEWQAIKANNVMMQRHREVEDELDAWHTAAPAAPSDPASFGEIFRNVTRLHQERRKLQQDFMAFIKEWAK